MRKTVAGAVVGVVAVCSVALSGDPERTEPPLSTATISTLGPPPDGVVGIILDGGALFSTDGEVSVGVSAPTSAAEVQVDVDPTFSSGEWRPLAGPVQIDIADSGYQLVFARVRTGPDGTPSRPAVAGITVDRTWDAATASASGTGRHRASWARMVTPSIVQVRIETGRVLRNGDAPDDAIVGRPIDTGPLDEATSWRFTDATAWVTVTSVSRVSRPWGQGATGPDDDDRVTPLVHDLYLELDAPLAAGNHRLVVAADVDPIDVVVDLTGGRSPSVHVNQVGFAPGDRGKVAFVSAWRGAAGGVDFPDAMGFDVVDAASREVVYSGTTTLRPSGDEMGRGDLTGAEVHEADFSALTAPGRYRVCVEQLGCSAAFVVSPDATWRRALVAVARAAYHQRSGVALGPPYTAIVRPRPFHPDDGVVFEQVTLTAIDDPTAVGRDDRYDEYPGSTTGEHVDDAWGGHFDAGDWNSRVEHLSYLSMALDLVRLYPDVYAHLDLAIPESGDAVPDLVDEGLWDLDLYRRLQHDDGGVPGAVDQGRFGVGEETSWSNTTGVYVYSPDPWSTYVYAAAAAQAAVVLRPYDADRAEVYRESAARAMEWADRAWASNDRRDELAGSVEPRRAAAAAAMLELTGDARWRDVVAESSPFDEGSVDLLDCDGGLCTTAWIVARLDPALTGADLHTGAVDSLRRHADAVLAAQASTSYAFALERPDLPIVWGLGPSVPHGVAVLRAFVVTGDQRYREAMVRTASFSLGGNPLDTSFVTGLGEQAARNPLIVDTIAAGIPVWPGTVVYGIHDLDMSTDDDWVEPYHLEPAGVQPLPAEVPLLLDWYDTGGLPMMDEFTFTQNHAAALWTLGVLAAT